MTRKLKPFFAALLAVLLVFTCMAPLVHAEAATQDEAAASLYAAEDLYYQLNKEEQQREDAQTACSSLCSLTPP